MNPLLASHLAKRDEFQSTLDAITAKAADESRDLTEAETANFNAAAEAIEKLDPQIRSLYDVEKAKAEIASVRAAFTDMSKDLVVTGGAGVGTPNRGGSPYGKDSRFSFFYDLANRESDKAAAERVNAHREHFAAIATSDVGEIVPPQYLTDDLLRKASIGRVAANLVTQRPWINVGMSHHYPRVSTTVAIGSQTENDPLTNTNPDTDEVTTSVVTLGGYTNESEQLLAQAGVNLDQEIFAQLREQYDAQVENYILNDTTEGILKVSGTNPVTYTDASPTVGEFGNKVGAAITEVAAARYRNANVVLMSARRAAWLKTQTDTTGRFIYSPVNPWNAPGGSFTGIANGLVGYFLDLPVYVSNYMPVTIVGATPSDQDPVVVANLAETRFREAGPTVALDRSLGFTSGTVHFRLMGMLSFTAKRAPAEISIISGSGLVNPF